jgi:DNA recombination protein RmuC
MSELLAVANLILVGIAGLFAFLAFRRAGRAMVIDPVITAPLAQLLRTETDRIYHANDDQGRKLRQELSDNLRGFQETTLRAFRELGDGLGIQVKEFGSRLDVGVKAIDSRAEAIATKLDKDISVMGQEANQHRDVLREAIESKLDDAAAKNATAAKESREEIVGSFKNLGSNVDQTLQRVADQQKERLEDVTKALGSLTEKQEKAQDALRESVEGKLESIRTANESKLEEMRRTVDEKLQSTLEARLGQSFQLVSDHLQKVSTGLGEMQQLASGVGDLKRMLTQVRARGMWGEAQLGALLEDFLSPDQYARNVAVNPASQERVEFAIRLPRLGDGHSEVYLPIDAKFPNEYFERVVAAAEIADVAAVEEASRGLERAVRQQAKDIATKYIVPPHTTDYAVLFLPSEALYAEVARRPGLVETISRESAVMISGPSTLTALLNAIRVGFRSALIHRQAGEISKLLQKVRSEFDKYGKAVQTAYNRAASTVEAISKLQTRQNVMGRALKGVDLLSADTPIEAARMLLSFESPEDDSQMEDSREEDSHEETIISSDQLVSGK